MPGKNESLTFPATPRTACPNPVPLGDLVLAASNPGCLLPLQLGSPPTLAAPERSSARRYCGGAV